MGGCVHVTRLIASFFNPNMQFSESWRTLCYIMCHMWHQRFRSWHHPRPGVPRTRREDRQRRQWLDDLDPLKMKQLWEVSGPELSSYSEETQHLQAIGWRWTTQSTTMYQSIFAKLIKDCHPSHTIRSADKLLLFVPPALSAKAFNVSAPSIWNSLSYNCRSADFF